MCVKIDIMLMDQSKKRCNSIAKVLQLHHFYINLLRQSDAYMHQ